MAISTQLGADFAQPVADKKCSPRNEPDKRVLTGLISLYRPRLGGFVVLLAYVLVMFLIYAGWQQRPEWPMTAESGPGYALGIIGGTLMLLLMLYPLRKHLRFMRKLGPTKYWFRTHMLFGVLGPVCILFHSGFQLGSLNSNIALFCMLIVASSGLVGRYFYTRIHHGLYGRKASLQELQQHSHVIGDALVEKLKTAPWILERIQRFEKCVSTQSTSLIGSLWTLLSLGIRTWLLYLLFRFVSDAKKYSLSNDYTLNRRYKTHLKRHIGAHLASIRKVAEFHFYERFFAIWHVLHYPLFLMLVVSGVVHVIAVHMY
ncbi:MAG: hypothetical protein U9P11_05310 [Pseudomonadota bacterium]|nr:hypothetical protein [Pseudomonadota bacterium]